MASGNFLRRLRASILLYILIMVAAGSWLARARTTDWNDTLWVAVHPVNADGSAASARYIEQLGADSFAALERFVAREAQRYGIGLENPIHIDLRPELAGLPPAPPVDRNVPGVMWWSIKLRFWSRRLDDSGPSADIDMLMLYHDPATHDVLNHSLALQKNLLGIVNAYASRDQAGANRVVLTHELMHTLGATDKYDMQTLQPAYPDGYAEPDRDPRFPQRYAELMGGRVPISETQAEMPLSLNETRVGPVTAREIRWVR